MTKVNGNGQNLEALKAYYEGLQGKKATKEEKQEAVKQVAFEPKEVEASALDVLAAQILGTKFGKVDKSDAATERRLEQAFANSGFMRALDQMQGLEPDFVAFASAHITGVNHDKLAKYLQKPLSDETVAGFNNFVQALA